MPPTTVCLVLLVGLITTDVKQSFTISCRFKIELSVCQSSLYPGQVRFPPISKIQPQAPHLVMPFHPFLWVSTLQPFSVFPHPKGPMVFGFLEATQEVFIPESHNKLCIIVCCQLRTPASETGLYPQGHGCKLSEWPWANYLTSLGLTLFICKIKITILLNNTTI